MRSVRELNSFPVAATVWHSEMEALNSSFSKVINYNLFKLKNKLHSHYHLESQFETRVRITDTHTHAQNASMADAELTTGGRLSRANWQTSKLVVTIRCLLSVTVSPSTQLTQKLAKSS